jgi:O-antigen ligase
LTETILNNGIVLSWRELLVRFALVFFCFALWPKGFMYWGVSLLTFAWLVDGGLSRFYDLLKEPLALGILVFCGVWIIGLLWSDLGVAFQDRWKKYFLLLTFLPLYSLLNKERLPWAIGGLISSYLVMVVLGSYSWLIQDMQGIPLFSMLYLHYSAALGIGVILAVFGGWVVLARGSGFLAVLLWLMALLLLFLQFNQSSRGFLLATLLALLLMVALRYRSERKILAGGLVSMMMIAALFAANSDVFHKRVQQASADLQSFQQGDYQTSVSYRLAIWDIGLHGIAERPLLGHGSGMAKQYLKDSYVTYDQGVYRNLSEFHEARHFHNELIEIGVHLGLLGILAFIFLLWCWFKTFRQHQMTLLGSAIVCFIFLSGLTDTFLITNRIPPFLLVVTAVAICWQRYATNLNLLDRGSAHSESKT